MAYPDVDSDDDGDDNLILIMPYTRPKIDDFFRFWTFHPISTKLVPILRRLNAEDAIYGIMSGTLVDRREALRYPVPSIRPQVFACIGPSIVEAVTTHMEWLSTESGKEKSLVFIEPKIGTFGPESKQDPDMRDSIPLPYNGKYDIPNTLPGWSMAIYFSNKFQSWPGIVELYTFPSGPAYIPLLPKNSIRFKFPIPTGGKKDFDVLTDVTGAHYSLRLQCVRELQAQWLRMGSIRIDEPGSDYVLNSLIIPEIVFMASMAPDVLDREHFVDFVFRGFDGDDTVWAEEVRVLVSHHIPFHFRGRKLEFVSENRGQ